MPGTPKVMRSTRGDSDGEEMVMYKCKKCDPCGITKKGRELYREEHKKREGLR